MQIGELDNEHDEWISAITKRPGGHTHPVCTIRVPGEHRMRTIDVTQKVANLEVALPSVERFWKLGDLTALRQASDGRFYRANYERGILLYALVARCRPRSVLEFGTGRGYGSMCIAWALEDHSIPGQVYTIDATPSNRSFKWPVNWGDGPKIDQLSRDQVWPEAAPQTWLDRIQQLTGFSGPVMRRWEGPQIDLAFIDAGHGYEAVRHDFYSVLSTVADPFGILFDDYVIRPGFGVHTLIDEEVAPHFDTELIYTDRRWAGGERAHIEHPEYGMIWIQSTGMQGSIQEIYPLDTRKQVLRQYYRRERITTLRFHLIRALHALRRWN